MSQQTEQHGARGIPTRAVAVQVLEGADAGQRASGDARLTVGTASDNDLVLQDPTVSRYHLELRRGPHGIEARDLGSTNGTLAGALRLTEAAVPAGTVLTLGKTALRVDDGEAQELDLHDGTHLAGLRGRSPAMRHLMAKVKRASQSDVAVLLVGESGTGKERIAEALHQIGPRRRGPFVTVDCGALAPTLVASELFGHEAGAFTGAKARHPGAFERADGGTLFLDEIGELPESLQATLLGALERRRFHRLGGREEIAVDVRVVSATHRDVRADVNTGRFRLDLFYRLAVVTLEVPPLRARPDDIELLAEHFLQELGWQRPQDVLTPPVLEALRRHHWPGNVRELRNFVEATVAMGEPPELHGAVEGAGADPFAAVLERPWKDARAAIVGELERRYFGRLIERTEGNVSEAARVAEMDRGHLTDLLRRHGLK
ncbi:MAG TPA: sigma 54-dependent Fis family transcriptional regulator [Polyangiaceae bacterium LLY-WYZ-15_(1-7)]|nr:sigma 54-dependent Fis family transcriptional regulator [Polyangiaceae bacterium LLY-WYZ-15_(1-7)]